mmetsp:Transcript_58711/g.109937  ORF Transcript_58711/g.109937 Transcript_58711/m.109937 type:complete len:132 (+) Transcript_58711:42-437(+)
MTLPTWMVYGFYGNALLDLVVFLVPGSIGVGDLINKKFQAGKKGAEFDQLIEHFNRVGGFAFLLHGAVRFCAGYCQTVDMIYLALFSYALEVAQLLYFISKGCAAPKNWLVFLGITIWSSVILHFGLGYWA